MYRTTNIKFLEAKQAKEVFQYKNTKIKLDRTELTYSMEQSPS
jgi:hypothetical protein